MISSLPWVWIAQSDAFVINRSGVLQTTSKFYGKVLENYPVAVPPPSYEPNVVEEKDPEGTGRPDGLCLFQRVGFYPDGCQAQG